MSILKRRRVTRKEAPIPPVEKAKLETFDRRKSVIEQQIKAMRADLLRDIERRNT